MTRRSRCSKFGEPNSETLLFCQMFSEFKRKAFVKITAPKCVWWLSEILHKRIWLANRSSYVLGWTLVFQKSPSLFLFHLTWSLHALQPLYRHVARIWCCPWLPPEVDTLFWQHPHPWVLLTTWICKDSLKLPIPYCKTTSEIRDQGEIHLFLGCGLVNLWTCLHKEVL